MIRTILLFAWIASAVGFESATRWRYSGRTLAILKAEKNSWNFPNPFKEVADMFSNWDDVVDDFMFKRMGNGEVFYGKRKYKPSNRPNTDGKYSGMGMTDKMKIDIAREIKEERMERRNQQANQQK